MILVGCNSKAEKSETDTLKKEAPIQRPQSSEIEALNVAIENRQDLSDFIPKGFVEYHEEGIDKISGDLNKDGKDDLVLLVKATDKSKIVHDENRGRLDRNRRGIIILFNKGDHYELAEQNLSCFSSENEDGGIYYAPDLSVSVEKGNLYIHYAHGRYGYWSYTFRNSKNDFDLIGYDSNSSRGPVTQSETSINFLTRKKLRRDNLNKDDDGDNYTENFKDTWSEIKEKKLLKLSDIKDFDELQF